MKLWMIRMEIMIKTSSRNPGEEFQSISIPIVAIQATAIISDSPYATLAIKEVNSVMRFLSKRDRIQIHISIRITCICTLSKWKIRNSRILWVLWLMWKPKTYGRTLKLLLETFGSGQVVTCEWQCYRCDTVLYWFSY